MLGWGLNIVVGLAGLLDSAMSRSTTVGAYSYALAGEDVRPGVLGFCCRWPASCRRFGESCFGFPVLRLRGDYLAIVTLAFGEIIRPRPDQLGRR